MNYFKIVDAGNFQEYNKQFLDYYHMNQTNFIPKNSFWNPLRPECLGHCLDNNLNFASGINKFGKVKEIAILFLHNDSSTLHIDHQSGLNRGVKARLNIPILNCEGSYTSFFELDEKTFNQSKFSKGLTRFWDDELRNELTPVSSVELIQPTILRTSSPHSVFCVLCKFPRISLTISFQNDVVHLLENDTENISVNSLNLS